ncbi:hypothetical protein HWX41_11815 [Bacillus paramycoides]|uniref:hypothetical protein n=1 Tax=Bacillus paramycoides TaxID=2026194 RepID=UPI0015BB3157|nr:hypothetical protein [Bacillus paramycoides]NWK69747.1 hypothetical protein [Bacillus paramycoides]
MLEDFQNDSQQLRDLQQNLIQPFPDAYKDAVKNIQPIQDAYKDAVKNIQPIQDAYKGAVKNIQSFQDAYKGAVENIQIFSEMTAHIKGIMDIIDWESINDGIAKRIKEIDELLQEQEKKFWCLDIEILDAIEDAEITGEFISGYVSENLESYVEKIIQDPIYELHATLIKETYEAFKGGFYKVCVMPLFAAFEHVLATWGDGNINADVVSVRQKPEIYKVTRAINPEKYIDIEQEQFTKVFSLSVIRMLQKTFVGVPKELCQELNRNSMAHGFHDYDSITKTDILKLFQLLKSTLVIRDFNVNEVRN